MTDEQVIKILEARGADVDLYARMVIKGQKAEIERLKAEIERLTTEMEAMRCDEKIINGLACLANEKQVLCASDAIALIQRQRAEIERLKTKIKEQDEDIERLADRGVLW